MKAQAAKKQDVLKNIPDGFGSRTSHGESILSSRKHWYLGQHVESISSNPGPPHAWQVQPEGPWVKWVVMAGRGCIAAGTKIFNPVLGRETPVEALYAAQHPTHVLSLSVRGPVVAMASAPFLKGFDRLYRYTLESGRSITVPKAHRFLTASGWRIAQDCAVGSRLLCGGDPRVLYETAALCIDGELRPEYCGDLLQSILESSPSALHEGAPRLRGTVPDYWERVVRIEDLGFGPYFDLTVPVYENYLAEGIWNHNSGKTRMGSEQVLDWAATHRDIRINIVARTIMDCRNTLFEGESGILSCLPNEYRDTFNKSLLQLTLPGNVFIQGYGADEPARLRGSNCHFAWADELASWRPKKKTDGGMAEHAWDMLLLGTRLMCTDAQGNPDGSRVIVTTTPKPVRIIKDLLKDSTAHVTRASTYDNAANLSPTFINEIIRMYEGTRLGKQELYAEVLDAMDGALWSLELLEELRVETAPELKRIVVGVDPAATSEEESNETGIVCVGVGYDDKGYVLEDWTVRDKPVGWARKAISLYKYCKADAIVAETNNGGEMVEATIHMVDPNVKVIQVHATRGKAKRAEPVSALYEQRRFHHVVKDGEDPRKFDMLEAQMTNYTSNDEYGLKGSPDRMDALVWAATELLVMGIDSAGILEWYRQASEGVRAKQAEEQAVLKGEKPFPTATAVAESKPKVVPLSHDPDYIRKMQQGRK